jgi:hypothetical protein
LPVTDCSTSWAAAASEEGERVGVAIEWAAARSAAVRLVRRIGSAGAAGLLEGSGTKSVIAEGWRKPGINIL